MTKPTHSPDEISIKDFIHKVRATCSYLKSKWVTILTLSILGAAIGLSYSIFKKSLYTASTTFVLDDGNKSGGLSQYAGLAAMAGIDIGGASGSSGIFQGDNILELYTSRSMIKKTFLSEGVFNGKKQLLIDRYIEFNKLRNYWKEKDKINNISFAGNPDNFNRTQDSIISTLAILFNKQILTVSKPDKKASIIRVDVTSTDELFAQSFNLKLVETVNEFYLQTKTKKSNQNIQILQHQADSVRKVLNSSIYGVASAIDAAPNANPSLQILRAPSQRKQVDVQASSAIYGEIVKNLELSKMSLRQETPLIQTIDTPVLPLLVTKTSKLIASIIGLFLGAFFISFWIVVKKSFQRHETNFSE
ncbi:lipopolysaccharide biosynthesis protein [Mucilaginibacter sp. cycad4]|uniref:lipopolysaccharide biosynthesis protein n=1 Tax=Mucilaginibacter sp. cycad4 TaxID=3342096 RepID=UPI002AAADD43|nr:lipopolysaccharide biosynthesis protein [Mucilaginibacter gossypii]WPV02341.1 lipopolysaccharide biosynthesis protein [Mucilaginibacter gossypii]